MRVAVLVAASTAWAIAVGCSSFSGDSPPEAPAPLEAGIETSAPVEAAASDAAPPAPRFCKTGDASTAAFCADFDEGPVDMGWTDPFISGGNFAITPSDRSAPNAFLATVDTFPTLDAGDGGDAGDAGPLTPPFSAALLATSILRRGATAAKLEFDIRLDELPTAVLGGIATGQLASMGLERDTRRVTLSFVNRSLYFVIVDPALSSGNITIPLGSPVGPGWFHVEMVTTFDGTGAVLAFNGVAVAAETKGINDSTDDTVFVDVGPAATATKGAARISYDSVVLNLF